MMTTIHRAMLLAFTLALAGCESKIVDLGIDATHDTGPAVDASTCRCRITRCRVVGDCALIGGACGPDFYCVGDFGACSMDTQCLATVTNSACTKAADSIQPCQ